LTKYKPPAATEWSRLLVRDVICWNRVPFRGCRGVMWVHSAFLSWQPWSLTF